MKKNEAVNVEFLLGSLISSHLFTIEVTLGGKERKQQTRQLPRLNSQQKKKH